MCTIREMLSSDEKIWVYIDNPETWKRFIDMAITEGFHFGELSAEKWNFSYVVAIHSNGDMGHLPLFIWCHSFSTNEINCPRKIDLRRYIENYEDYSCKESHFKSSISYHKI